MPRWIPALFAALLAAAPALRAGSPAYNATVLADNPIGFWPCDELAGATAADLAGSARNGVYENAVLGRPGGLPGLGTSVELNGINARIRIPFDASFNLGTGDFTVELWFRTTGTTRADIFNFKNTGDFGIFCNDSAPGSLRGWHNGMLPGPTAANAVPVNAWHHVAYVRQAGVISLYIDGVFHSSAADTQGMSANADIFVGSNTGTFWFPGRVDEVAYYGTALSAARVAARVAAAQIAPAQAPVVTTAAPTGIHAAGATVGGGFIQPGIPDAAVTVFYGPSNGGTNAVDWAASVELGTRSNAFATALTGLQPGTTYHAISRAVNASGTSWGQPAVSFTTPAAPPPGTGVVLHEIHYHPVELPAFNPDGTPALDLTDDVHEFIELLNASAAPADVSGWSLDGGVSLTFGPGTVIPAGGYLVAARNPARLQTVYPGLAGVHGPWTGTLANGGETVRLRDAAGATVDGVSYGSDFPWPNGADALGASDDFTLLNSAGHQYRGRSLQRVSATAPANDPANWLASPLGASPSPGLGNAVTRAQPKPVALAAVVAQDSDDAPVLRAGQAARVEIVLSATNGVSAVQVEYFVDAIDGTNAFSETRLSVPMTPVGLNRYTALVPGQADRSVVRWRVRADRGDGIETVYPRTDDAAIVPTGLTAREHWAAWFVQPARTTARAAAYDVLVPASDATSGPFNGLNGLAAMDYNISGAPKRVTNAASTGLPRDVPFVPATDRLWNGSVPCVVAQDGVVRDALLRHHGSRYNRRADRNSFKLRFADTQKLNGADSLFITDKSDYFSVAHGLYRAANLPLSHVRWVDWFLNGNAALVRLEQGEYNGDLLDSYHRRMRDLNPGSAREETGEFVKNTGTIEADGEGPYGCGDGRILPAAGPWSTLQRVEWTYALQNHAWKGALPMKQFWDGLWAARGDTHAARNPNLAATRAYLDATLDVDTELTSMAILNWMCPWDDTTQNHFYWRRANGRWVHLPWDFDGMFGNGDTTGTNSWIMVGRDEAAPAGYLGNNSRGPNFFKDSFLRAYEQEYKDRLWLLNHTLLSPASLQALTFTNANGAAQSYYSFINGVKANFCERRFESVNTQCGRAANGSDFLRPARPLHLAPAHGGTLLPPATLAVSAYGHGAGNTAESNAHASSTWEIRPVNGTYAAPVFRLTSTNALTALAVPFEALAFGQSYAWRVTHTDASGHPSLVSAETTFTFGPQAANQTLVAWNAAWKFNSTLAFTDNTWTLPGYDDSGWSDATGVVIQAGEAVPPPGTAGTTVPAPGTLSPAGRAYLFRTTFTLSAQPAALTNLRLRHLVDDGCVVWVNGARVHRYFMNDQAAYGTAEFSVGGPGEASLQTASAISNTAIWSWTDPRPHLTQGVNVIAVEVHQNGAGSSDVMMGLELTADLPALGGEVAINEVLADNRAAFADGAAFPDYIELRNNLSAPVDLGGWGLSDSLLDPLRYAFPTGTVLAAHARLLVRASASPAVAQPRTGFGVGAGGQTLLLSQGNTVKDTVTFGPQAPDIALARAVDGVGAWVAAAPSPDAANPGALPLGDATGLRVNEVMAAPRTGEDWFELFNPATNAVALGGLFLSDTAADLRLTSIPPLSFIGPRGHTRFEADGRAQGANHCNFKLSALGESVRLSRADGAAAIPIDALSFGAQAQGVSIGRRPDGGATIEAFPGTASPGAENFREPAVVVHEALANSAAPRVDFIELRNLSGAPVDAGGWWLSDDPGAPRKYQLPSPSVIPAGGVLVVDEAGFNPVPGAPPSFALGAGGDEILLSVHAPDGAFTGLRSRVSFGASVPNVSFGRVDTAEDPEFWPQASPTPGAANSAPRTRPVLVNEVHYHPADLPGGLDNERDEFIELHNPDAQAVDLGGWALRNDAGFTFPPGTVLPAGGYLLVLGFPPADSARLDAFRAALGVAPGVPVAGPFAPRLSNADGTLELARPGEPGLPPPLVDRVSYLDRAPWPAGADGGGFSLQRASRAVIGNDAANWTAAAPTPGGANAGQSAWTDADGDGLPDGWETENGYNPALAADGALDSDGDGAGARAEFMAGTSPADGGDALRGGLEVAAAPGGAAVIRFTARADRAYSVQRKGSASDAAWVTVGAVPARAHTREEAVTDPAPGAGAVYRIATPPAP